MSDAVDVSLDRADDTFGSTPAPGNFSSTRRTQAFLTQWAYMLGEGSLLPDRGMMEQMLTAVASLPEDLAVTERARIERRILATLARLRWLLPPEARERIDARLLVILQADVDETAWRGRLLDLLQQWATESGVMAPATPEALGRLISCVLDELDRRFREPGLNLDDLARGVLSRRVLSRAIWEHTGRRFLEHLHDRRTREAHRLLIETFDTVDQIADLVGYSSVVQLRRHYMRRFGRTPMDVRMDRKLRRR